MSPKNKMVMLLEYHVVQPPKFQLQLLKLGAQPYSQAHPTTQHPPNTDIIQLATEVGNSAIVNIIEEQYTIDQCEL